MTIIEPDDPEIELLGLDAYGNPGAVAAGELIESAWGTSVAERVVAKFPNKAALDAWAPTNGRIAATTDNGRLWIRTTGAWTLIVGRAGCTVSNTGQVYSAGQAVPLLFPDESLDTDSFHAAGSGDIVIPAGFGGVYGFVFGVTAASTVTAACAMSVNFQSRYVGNYIPVNGNNASAAGIGVFAAGDILKGQIHNATGANLFFSGHFNLWRISA